MNKVTIRLTGQGAKALEGSAIAEIGNLDVGTNTLTFDAAQCSPGPGGVLRVESDNPHEFYIAPWAYVAVERALGQFNQRQS